LFVFPRLLFLFLKTSKAKYECVKSNEKHFQRMPQRLFFIDFDLLRKNSYSKIFYLLAEER